MAARNKQPIFALPPATTAPLGVIGFVLFDLTGGVVTMVAQEGCVAGVTFVSTGVANIALFPQQAFYTIGGFVSDDNTNASFLGLSVTSATFKPNGFQINAAGTGPVVNRNASLIGVVIFGPMSRQTKDRRLSTFGLPAGPLSVIGMATYSQTSATTVANVRVAGCVASVTPSVSFLADINLWPAQPFYTYWATMSSNLINATFAALNASATSGTYSPYRLNLQPVGISPIVGVASNVCMVTIFGPSTFS